MKVPTSQKDPRVLILEEETFIQDTLTIKFAAQGVTAFTARSEEEARNLVLADPPDAIIIDILHPRIPAYAFVQWAKGQPKVQNIPVIILTFKEQDPEVEFLYNVWTEDYFTKPFSPREVVKRVMEIIRTKG